MKRARAFLGRVLLGLTSPTFEKMEGMEVGKVMRRKYICKKAGIVEITQFPVSDREESTADAKGRIRWRRAKSTEDKRDENARLAVRRLARTINCNLDAQDYLVTLTYSEESYDALFRGMDQDQAWEAAREELSKIMQKVMRKARRQKMTVRHIDVTADMDGETGELVRVHHHVLITGNAMQLLQGVWEHGMVDVEHLYRQSDYTPLAAYLLAQVRHFPNRNKYNCSLNMEKPEVQEEVFDKDPETEIRVQPGAKVLDRTPYREGSVVQYVRYKRRPATQKRGGKKLGNSQETETQGSGFEFSSASWI